MQPTRRCKPAGKSTNTGLSEICDAQTLPRIGTFPMPFPHYLGYGELGRVVDRMAGPILNRAVGRSGACRDHIGWAAIAVSPVCGSGSG